MITQAELMELQARLASGTDKGAFRDLFKATSPGLCRFARQYVSIEDAEEAVYLVLTRLWKNRASILEITHLNTYLYKAVRFEVIKINKRKQRHHMIVLDDETERSNMEHFSRPMAPDAILATKELHHFLNRQVEQLPPKCRLAFKLIKEDGLKYSEAAEVMGVSKNTLENHMSKAIRHLKEALVVYQKEQEDPLRSNTGSHSSTG